MNLLELAKQNETPESVFIFMDDVDSKKIMAAWLLFKPVYKDREASANDQQNAFNHAWNIAGNIDMYRLADLADLPLMTTRDKFNRLKAAGILYPDGTIHRVAQRLMLSEITSRIRTLMGTRREPPAQKPPAEKKKKK